MKFLADMGISPRTVENGTKHCQFQPEQRSHSWLATIREQREQLELLLEENPSLKPYLPEALAIAYRLRLNIAVRETALPYETFPANCCSLQIRISFGY